MPMGMPMGGPGGGGGSVGGGSSPMGGPFHHGPMSSPGMGKMMGGGIIYYLDHMDMNGTPFHQ
jgi:hypothetical protein